MISKTAKSACAILLAGAIASPALSADMVVEELPREQNAGRSQGAGSPGTITGRVAVMDGRTLWFPEHRQKVRLAEIDACELPQWAYDPKLPDGSNIPIPVPCGPLAKAWLKRTVGSAAVTCRTLSHADDGALVGRCTLAGRDLAIEMLRVGWARIVMTPPLRGSPNIGSGRITRWPRATACGRPTSSRWANGAPKPSTRQPARKPIADFNLLAERESKISPPFQDARNRPSRTDR